MAKPNIILELDYNLISDKLSRVSGGVSKVVNNGTIAEGTSFLVARKLVKSITKRYQTYLNDVVRDQDLEHTESDATFSITDTKKGWVVHVKGEDILYHEYGTGTRGLENPHPKHSKDGMKPYGSGKYIIHDGIRNNGKDLPYWYILYQEDPGHASELLSRDLANDFNDEPIRRRDYVWRHNYVITKGLPAGKFIYDSFEEIQDFDILGEKEVLKKTITQDIQKRIVPELEDKLKELRTKSR